MFSAQISFPSPSSFTLEISTGMEVTGIASNDSKCKTYGHAEIIMMTMQSKVENQLW